MFSRGEQAGFEATIIRPDGTKFNEYDVKHRTDDGRAVTECWLECEDDAVFEIKLVREFKLMKRFTTSEWRNTSFVDGRKLYSEAWINVETPSIRNEVYTKGPGKDQFRKGVLTFSVPETTSLDQAGINKPDVQQGIGTIEIWLRPGKWTAKAPGPPTCLDALGTMKESESKLARITKSTNEQDYKEKIDLFNQTPEYPTTWQTFIFKYRHRAALEVMGVIEASEVTPPAKVKPTNRKRNRDSSTDVKTDPKPNIRKAGPSRSLSVELEGDGSDSDEDDRAWKAAKARRIKKLQAEIDKLKGGSRSKEKMSGKMKAKKDRPIDLCSDSD